MQCGFNSSWVQINTRPSRIFFQVGEKGNPVRRNRFWKFQTRTYNGFWVIYGLRQFWNVSRGQDIIIVGPLFVLYKVD